eukprot:scaffold44525_cov36-Prasinocladus_malaysianus.AAC.1
MSGRRPAVWAGQSRGPVGSEASAEEGQLQADESREADGDGGTGRRASEDGRPAHGQCPQASHAP